MNHLFQYLSLSAAACASLPAGASGADSRKTPNVLFIIMDDMCDWQHYLGGNSQVRTPNLDRLAQRGVVFSNTYCGAPLSNPSRASMLTGIPPYVSGVYGNNHEWDDSPAVRNALSMPEHFKNSGYTTCWAGKIYHTRPSGDRLDRIWDDRSNADGGYGPWPQKNARNENAKWRGIKAWTDPDTDFPDVRNSARIIEFLGQPHDRPFFAAMGFYRPHTPYTAPRRYFEMYDADTLRVPETIPNDLDDIPQYAFEHFIERGHDFHLSLAAGDQHLWRERVRAYLACISFADDHIGMILDALDRSPYADNTYIVLVGDNGFHHGEKQRWGKAALWREAGHVPMIIAGPKNSDVKAGGRCESVVSLLDVYPTLSDVCNLPKVTSHKIHGKSIRPLLSNPEQKWDMPVTVSFLPGNFTIHTNEWSYIRYADHSEELYSTQDENEFYNVASDSRYAPVKEKLLQLVPQPSERAQPVTPRHKVNAF